MPACKPRAWKTCWDRDFGGFKQLGHPSTPAPRNVKWIRVLLPGPKLTGELSSKGAEARSYISFFQSCLKDKKFSGSQR